MVEFGHTGENLSERFGNFDVVYSLEVIEHVFDPYEYIEQIYWLLEDRGICILSTPYHGYLKNLVISLLGKWDKHFTVLWSGGHIKFWSKSTITKLLQVQGFELLDILRVGCVGIEPTTRWLRVTCSTNWANNPLTICRDQAEHTITSTALDTNF